MPGQAEVGDRARVPTPPTIASHITWSWSPGSHTSGPVQRCPARRSAEAVAIDPYPARGDEVGAGRGRRVPRGPAVSRHGSLGDAGRHAQHPRTGGREARSVARRTTGWDLFDTQEL